MWSTCWKVQAPERGVFVGRPIANTRIHVLDAQRKACAIGVAGEIYIAGSGVALGYHGRAELTAERFLAGESGARMYRSGDLGRWRHDGQLEHLGRLDAQLKLRGFRIEPGEIEHRLASHPGVASALVVVREDRKDDARLVAYVVPRAEMPPAAELREHLRQSLPEHMLPQHYVALSALPLLPNGKTDRAGLPQPSNEARFGTGLQDPPRSPAEIGIAAIWQRLLSVSQISVTDNFFDLGGHSMLAMQAVGEMQTALGRTINLRRLIFESLEQIAVGEAGPNNAVEPPPRAVQPSGLFGRLKGVFGVSRKSDRIADSSR